MSEPWLGVDGTELWELQWDENILRKADCKYGITGVAKVISPSSGAGVPQALVKAHLCTHNLCQAPWHVSAYGVLGPPIHVQHAEDWWPHAPQQNLRPCLLPQARLGLLWSHRWAQETATIEI